MLGNWVVLKYLSSVQCMNLVIVGISVSLSSLLMEHTELDLLSGIAALLTYPLDIEMVEMEEEDEKAAQEAQQ